MDLLLISKLAQICYQKISEIVIELKWSTKLVKTETFSILRLVPSMK